MWTRSLQPTTALLISPWNCPGTLGSRTCLTCHRRILTLLNSWFVLNHAVSTALSKYTGSQVGHAGIYQYRAFGDQAEMTHATNHASPIKRLAFCSDDSVCVSVCASPWLCVGMQQPIAALKASVDWGYYEIGMPSLAKQAPRTTFKEQKCSLKLANTPQMHMGSDMQTMIAALIKHPPDRIQNFRHASPWYYMIPDTNRTAQGRGGSLKDRKPVGQVWLFCQSPGRIVRESIQLLSC